MLAPRRGCKCLHINGGRGGRPSSALLPSDVLSSRFLDSEAEAETERYLPGATAHPSCVLAHVKAHPWQG